MGVFMFTINCKKCDNDLMIDEMATMDEYNKDMNYLVDDIDKIIESTIQQYLIYKCIGCGEVYKYTYKNWEEQIRSRIAKEVMEIRMQQMFAREINPSTIDESNGIEYCGQCGGYGGDGWCLKDIIKQCTIRKK